MSNNYGLVVNNSNGGIMFDSRRGMNSYVVKEVGTGTSTSAGILNDDFIFIKRPYGQSSSFYINNVFLSSRDDLVNGNAGLVPQGAENGAIRNFFKFDLTTETYSTATVDYFVITHSSNVDTTSEDYGLLINNSNGSIQFDSRSVTSDNHFLITGYHQPGTISGNPNISAGLIGLGDLSDYWSTNWTSGSMPTGLFVESLDISGIRWVSGTGGSGGPLAVAFTKVTSNNPFGGTTSNISYRSIHGMIISAELV